jgi:hypothetical protein
VVTPGRNAGPEDRYRPKRDAEAWSTHFSTPFVDTAER